MTYICIECGTEVEYGNICKDCGEPTKNLTDNICSKCSSTKIEHGLIANKLKCTKCREKRSNIWIKKRPEGMTKTILAR